MPQDCEQILLQVTKNNVKAGKGTSIYSENDYTFFPICKNGKNYGAIGVFVGNNPIDAFDESIVNSVIGECALAVDGIVNAKERERAAVLAKTNNCVQTCYVPYRTTCELRLLPFPGMQAI